MSLAGMLEKLYARRRFGIRPGLDRVRLLLDRLGNPERSFRSIHVVGTNGKGSTSAFLSSILSAAGFRAALFTSPHLVSFNERFRVNGLDITTEQLEQPLAETLASAPHDATFFEIVTALAALAFSREQADIVVMEAGMGGRSDATAAISGIMTLITPISLDHCAYLGGSLADIALEKAGIAEPGTPVLIARQSPEAGEVIRDRCDAANPRCLWSGADFSAAWSNTGTLDYRGLYGILPNLTPGIPGRYQAENASLALAAAEALAGLGLMVPSSALRTGLSSARWPGRMEMIPGQPRILLDGAHNPEGASALAVSLADYRYRRLLLVAGIMEDKDCRRILAPLVPHAATCYCVTPAMERALDASSLATIISEMGGTPVIAGDVAGGITAACRDAAPDDLVLVCGSLFTVGAAKAWLSGQHFKGIRG